MICILHGDNIVAVTPFVLSAQAGAFTGFSFLDSNGNWKNFAQEIMAMSKIKGEPQLVQTPPEKNVKIQPIWTGNLPRISNFDLLASLKAIFSRMFSNLK